jgi:hypothetical protein
MDLQGSIVKQSKPFISLLDFRRRASQEVVARIRNETSFLPVKQAHYLFGIPIDQDIARKPVHVIKCGGTLWGETWLVTIQLFDCIAIILHRFEGPIVTPEAPRLLGIPGIIEQFARRTQCPDSKLLRVRIWDSFQLHDEVSELL